MRTSRIGAITRSLAIVVSASLLGLAGIGAASALAAEPAAFFNGFEADTQGWTNATRVASGTGGVTSSAGSFHALAGSGAYTQWGGYSSTFPPGGFTTSVDVYLDVACPADDTRFDWTSAVSDSSGGFHRDFVFNAGCYTTGGNHFTISASNNAGRGSSYPANPGRSPIDISTSGWYTLKHRFYNDGGVLAVDLSIVDASGVTLHTWTLSDSSDAIAGIGGNRYGWFAQNEFGSLAIDNSRLTVTAPACDTVIDKSASPTWRLTHDCTTDHTVSLDDGVTFDGQGHTITAVDPSGGHFLGAVVANGGVSADIANLRVTSSNLADVCDGGTDRLRGILLDNAAGSITDTTVTGVRQGNSGCQEGNAIEVRNFATGAPQRSVTISGDTVAGYQKNGITANGAVAATITNNTATGDGPISYIAQNGIQVGFGATAFVRGNSASGNDYSPSSDIACGLLLYQADGVKASNNALFANERDQCNFGKGGGSFNSAS
jgi:Right handed beta helix region